jgi:hypothetical protein
MYTKECSCIDKGHSTREEKGLKKLQTSKQQTLRKL